MRASVPLALLSIPAVLAKLNKDVNAVAYYDPRKAGGSMLSIQNEPLNIIVSGLSDPSALSDRGINNWANSINLYGSPLWFKASFTHPSSLQRLFDLPSFSLYMLSPDSSLILDLLRDSH
jgi:hypothetical protein